MKSNSPQPGRNPLHRDYCLASLPAYTKPYNLPPRGRSHLLCISETYLVVGPRSLRTTDNMTPRSSYATCWTDCIRRPITSSNLPLPRSWPTSRVRPRAPRPIDTYSTTVPEMTPVVTELFGGWLQQCRVCNACSHVSRTFAPFMDLSLPIP